MSAGKPSVLLVPYRWGSDLGGGAERLHRRFAEELRDAGCAVEVWTTTAHRFRPFCHWGNLWNEFLPAGTSDDEGIRVRRFPATKYPKAILALLAKSVQRVHESQQPTASAESIAAVAEPLLGRGWHEAELAPEGRAIRWTMQGAEIHLPARTAMANIRIEGDVEWKSTITVVDEEGRILASEPALGTFAIEVAVPTNTRSAVLQVKGARRPLREFRTLGVRVSRVSLGEVECDLWRDARSFVTDAEWWKLAARRPGWANLFFDVLRGPNSPLLARALGSEARKFDIVVSMNLPWRIVPPAKGPVHVVLPLLHPGDGFYYWSHYAARLKGADLVAAMTPASAREVFEPIGAKSAVIGPPVWPGESSGLERRSSRKETRVLTVSRKSPDKRYMEIARSIARLRAKGVAIEGVGVGEEMDGARLPEGTTWLGALSEEQIRDAWRDADVFALMSESESFGMVVVEAWHAGLPVVVNRRSRAVASLVRSGIDGIVASPGPELDAALKLLAESPEMRRRMGDEGRARAQREFTRGKMAERFIAAVEPLLASRAKASTP